MTDIHNNSDELRAITRKLSEKLDHAGIEILKGNDTGEWQKAFFEAEDALTRWRERAVAEARIDELAHVDGLPQCFQERNGMMVHMPIDKRLGELRALLKEQTDEQD